MAKTSTSSNAIINAEFRGAALGAPSIWYVALFVSGVEVSGNGYTRAAVAADSSHWNAASGGATANTLTITYTTPTGSWGTVDSAKLMDASTSGNAWYTGSLVAPATVNTGEIVTFAAGALTVTES